MKKMAFKNRVFNDNVVRLKTERFSPFFVKTVLNLLESKCVERLTPGEALAILRPYEYEITNLEEFTPDREKSRQSLEAFQEKRSSNRSGMIETHY